MYNHTQTDAQNPTQPQSDQSFVRQIGRILGRMFATLGAAVTMRVVGREMGQKQPNNQPNAHAQQQNTLLQEIQQEIPVAAATLLIWNTGFGAETGANVSEFIVNNIREAAARYIAAPVQYTRSQIPSFADHLSSSFMTHISHTVVQGVQNMPGFATQANTQNNPRNTPYG